MYHLGDLATGCFLLAIGRIRLDHSFKVKSLSVTNSEKLLGKFAVQETERLRTRTSCSGGENDTVLGYDLDVKCTTRAGVLRVWSLHSDSLRIGKWHRDPRMLRCAVAKLSPGCMGLALEFSLEFHPKFSSTPSTASTPPCGTWCFQFSNFDTCSPLLF